MANANTLRMLALSTFFLGAGLLFVVSPSLLSRHVAVAPRAADPQSGHVHAFNQHGTVVYLSMSEQLGVAATAGLGIVLLGVCGMLMKRGQQ